MYLFWKCFKYIPMLCISTKVICLENNLYFSIIIVVFILSNLYVVNIIFLYYLCIELECLWKIKHVFLLDVEALKTLNSMWISWKNSVLSESSLLVETPFWFLSSGPKTYFRIRCWKKVKKYFFKMCISDQYVQLKMCWEVIGYHPNYF